MTLNNDGGWPNNRYLVRKSCGLDLTNIPSAKIWSMFSTATEYENCPVGAFPGSAGDFFTEICKRHPELGKLIVAFGAPILSAAAQAHGDVLLPWTNLPSPLGLYTFAGAPSWSGKSFIDDLIASPFDIVAKERDNNYQDLLSKQDRAVREWKRELKRLEKEIDNAETSIEISRLKVKLDELYLREPKTPRLRPLSMKDVSPRARAESFEGNRECVLIHSAEAGGIVKNGFFDDISTLNDIHDGNTIRLSRGNRKHIIGTNPRFAVSIATQTELFISYLLDNIKELQSLGFQSRLILVLHESDRPLEVSGEPWINQDAYNEHLIKLLRAAPTYPTCQPKVHEFQNDARDFLLNIKRDLHVAIGPGGSLEALRPYLARSPEMIARQAAAFHVFEERDDPIPLETVQQASAVISFLAHETARVGHEVLPQVQFSKEKALVEGHVVERLRAESCGEIEWDILYRSTHPAMRRRARPFTEVMNALQTEGKIRVYHKRGIRMVCLPQS